MEEITGMYSKPNGLSMEEFQKQLCAWIQDKGLLSELRAHLRKKMICMLQETTIDKKSPSMTRLCLTPKMHALNLLVAEFLLSQELHYSLSVFSSEVSAVAHITAFCEHAQNAVDSGQRAPRLQESDVWDILEAIGLDPLSSEAQRAYDMYTSNVDCRDSLLLCSVKSMTSAISAEYQTQSNKGILEQPADKVLQPSQSPQLTQRATLATWDDLIKLLTDNNLKQYKKSVFKLIDKEIQKVRTLEKEKYRSKIQQHQKTLVREIKMRESLVLNKLDKAEKRLYSQKQIIEGDLKKKQSRLQELADELNHVHTQLTKREEQIQNRTDELLARQVKWTQEQSQNNDQLDGHRSEVDQVMSVESDRLCKERETLYEEVEQLRAKKKELEQSSVMVSGSNSEMNFLHDLQKQCSDLKTELEQTRSTLNQPAVTVPVNTDAVNAVEETSPDTCSSNSKALGKDAKRSRKETKHKCDDARLSSESLFRGILTQLQSENTELRSQLQSHRTSIDDLRSQLADSRTVRDVLHSRVVHQLNVPSTPLSVLAVPLTPTLPSLEDALPPRSVGGRQRGAGEDLNLLQGRQHYRRATRAYHRSGSRGSPARRSPQNIEPEYPSSDVSDQSPTEGVIRDARERLRSLEGESEALERAYRDYQRRNVLRGEVLAKEIAAHRDLVDLGLAGMNAVYYNTAGGLPCKRAMARKRDIRYEMDRAWNVGAIHNNTDAYHRSDEYYISDRQSDQSDNSDYDSMENHYFNRGFDKDAYTQNLQKYRQQFTDHCYRRVPQHYNVNDSNLDDESDDDAYMKTSCRNRINLLEDYSISRPHNGYDPDATNRHSVYSQEPQTTNMYSGPQVCSLLTTSPDNSPTRSLSKSRPDTRRPDSRPNSGPVKDDCTATKTTVNQVNRKSTVSDSLDLRSTGFRHFDIDSEQFVQVNKSTERIRGYKKKTQVVKAEKVIAIDSRKPSENATNSGDNEPVHVENEVHRSNSEVISLKTNKDEGGLSPLNYSSATSLLCQSEIDSSPRNSEHHLASFVSVDLLVPLEKNSNVESSKASSIKSMNRLPTIPAAPDANYIKIVKSEDASSVASSNKNSRKSVDFADLKQPLTIVPASRSISPTGSCVSSVSRQPSRLNVTSVDSLDAPQENPIPEIKTAEFVFPNEVDGQIEIGIPNCTCPMIETPRPPFDLNLLPRNQMGQESPSDSPRFSANLCASLADPLLPIYPKKIPASIMPSLTPVSERTEETGAQTQRTISPRDAVSPRSSVGSHISVGKLSSNSEDSSW